MSATVSAIDAAKRGLDSVLRRGQDSSKARQELTEAERKAEADQAAQARALEQVAIEKRQAIEQLAEGELTTLRQSIAAECEALLPGFAVDISIDGSKLISLLSVLADRRSQEEAKALFAEESASLQNRLDGIQTQIDAIRQSPERSDADLGRLHILSLDAADLSGMLAATQQQFAEVQLPDTSIALKAWNSAAKDARYQARYQVMLELESRLLRLAEEAHSAYGLSSTAYRWKLPLIVRQAAQQGII